MSAHLYRSDVAKMANIAITNQKVLKTHVDIMC